MSTIWIIVADDTSAASLAHVAGNAGAEACAIVLGSLERATTTASLEGISHVVRCDTEALAVDAWAPAIAKRAADERPRAIITCDNAFARAIAGAAAAAIGAVAISSVISVDASGDAVVVEHAVAEGAAVNVARSEAPVLCIVGDGGEEAEQTGNAAISDAEIPSDAPAIKILETNMEVGGGANLAHAERVVSVGLGVGAKENLVAVEELAKALGAEIACTLPLCDTLRWFEHSSVVGTSTQKISPRLYLTCGASGQPQHMSGVRGAKKIVAINNDPDAPIMSQCAYGILGDMNKVVPALTAAIKAL